jgi:hypothetical protein
MIQDESSNCLDVGMSASRYREYVIFVASVALSRSLGDILYRDRYVCKRVYLQKQLLDG